MRLNARHAAPAFVPWAFLLFLFLLGAPPALLGEETKQTYRLIPQWVPQAQFAGYYTALEKGFFLKRGLQVEILRGGPEKPPSKLLQSGQAEFGTFFLASAIKMKADGLDLTNTFQLVQDSSQMLLAKKSSGINSAKDLEGRKVGLWGSEFQLQPNAFFAMHGVRVRPVQQSVTVNLFLRDGVDVVSAMWHNEYHSILNSGIDPEELTVFFFKDVGLNFPEDGLYCLSTFIEQNPEDVRKFVQASAEGWAYAFEHEEEALDIVMRHVEAANVATNRVHQRWMLKRMKDISTPPGKTVGELKREDYENVSRELKKAGFIENIPDFSGFYHHD